MLLLSNHKKIMYTDKKITRKMAYYNIDDIDLTTKLLNLIISFDKLLCATVIY